jgi:hypothetical protein
MIFCYPWFKTYHKVIDPLIESIKTNLDKEKTKHISFSFFIRQTSADIFMSHGCADKNYHIRNNCIYLKKFKYIMVPGPWMKRKLIRNGIPSSKIYCVGWPKIDNLLKFKRNTIKKNTTKNKRIKILWAPSHSHKYNGFGDASSFPIFSKYLKKLESEGFIILQSLHVSSQEKKNVSITLNQYSGVDYVIADFGSTVYESWALGIPVIFPDWIVKKKIYKHYKGSGEEYIYKNNIGIHANSIDEIISIIKSNRNLDQGTIKFLEDYLPSKFNGKSGYTIAKIIENEIAPKIKKNFLNRLEKNNITANLSEWKNVIQYDKPKNIIKALFEYHFSK